MGTTDPGVYRAQQNDIHENTMGFLDFETIEYDNKMYLNNWLSDYCADLYAIEFILSSPYGSNNPIKPDIFDIRTKETKQGLL